MPRPTQTPNQKTVPAFAGSYLLAEARPEGRFFRLVEETTMRGYHKIISEATGITDERQLSILEEIMRHDIFHSTLDWQTKEQLASAAREAVGIALSLATAQ